jgi:threonine dehydrogenase-like Zn-dependent dehydrogenase
MSQEALALWTIARGQAELRPAKVAPPAEDQIQVRALMSGISRGTETLVFQGKVPLTEWTHMRCPHQEGAFSFPVKYGYAMVGEALDGTTELVGKRVFALHPHQSLFNLPIDAAVAVPDDIPTARAVLAPQMETALNATWDAAPRLGDRIAVVGGGVIGLLTAYLCARTPGTDVTLIDTNPSRADLARSLGLGFTTPIGPLPSGCDLVFHASSTSAGLNLALSLAGFEGTVIELSWFGDTPVTLDLGGAFHSRRLTLRASQVGAVALARRARWDYRRRLTKALSLCADPRLDALVAERTPFAQMPERMGEILRDPDTLCHLIQYQES